MKFGAIDVRPWNLGLPLAVLTACGRTLPLLPGADGGADTEATDTEDPTGDPTGEPTGGGECNTQGDCPPGYYCYENACIGYASDTNYCNDGGCCYDGCCYDGCCYDGCYYSECYGDDDCAVGYACEYNICVPAKDPQECVEIPASFFGPQPLYDHQGGVSLAFVDLPEPGGRELVIADAVFVQRVGPSGTTLIAELATRGVAVGDLDRDGDDDIVAVADDALHAFVFDEQQGFVPGSITAVPPDITGAIDLLDFDGDGDADAFVQTSTSTLYFAALGDGGFAEGVPVAGPACGLAAARSYALPPPTQDVVYGEAGSIWVASGGPKVSFDPYGPAAFGLGPVCPLGSGDFDDDGTADAVVLDAAGTGAVTWWTAIATIPPSYSWSPPDLHRALAVADLDLDGKDDVVLAGESGTIAMRFGRHPDLPGSDPLGCYTGVSPGISASVLAVGDLDGSGRPDLVLADAGTVWVLYAAP
jgi:hypothetical protein